jgi:hypothetical protein
MTDLGDRYREKFEEKQAEMYTDGLDWKPVALNAASLYLGYFFLEWIGFLVAGYVVIGTSLARRQGYGKWTVEWLGTALLWPILLAFEAVFGGEDQ